MPWAIYDYRNARNENEFKTWTLKLKRGQKGYLAKLNVRIDLLEEHGMGLCPHILEGPLSGFPNTYKLTMKGRVQLRPMLCRGPVDNNTEFTFLIGAIEKDWEYVPSSAPQQAEDRRAEIIRDPNRRMSA